MNLVGHIHLARLRLGDRAGSTDDDSHLGEHTTGFLIGSALPDIAAMGRFRLTAVAARDAVREGVELHHRTDDVFHRHDWFRHHNRAVTTELERLGLSRGAARACGHVGVELLLDGRLMAVHPDLGPSAEAAIGRVGDPDFALLAMVDTDRRPQWGSHLESVASWSLPGDYRHPAAVARRLRRILARRPRLAFGPEQEPAVERVLTNRQAELEGGIDDLIDAMRAAMST